MSHEAVPDEVHEYNLFVDGVWVEPKTEETFDVEFPATGERWAEVAKAGPADVSNAIGAARRRFESTSWQRMTATDRGELLFSIADELEEHIAELARLEALGNGKRLTDCRAQVEALPDWFRYYGGLADKVSGRTMPVDDPDFLTYTRREPYGVVAAITPWNSPLMLATYKIAPAIAAGNTVVLKPSEATPVTSLRLAEIATQAGLPSGALNVVPGFGSAGVALTDDDRVAKVAFTGGVETGRKVGAAAGQGLNSAVLELGGKSPNIVFPDTDVEEAVRGAIRAIFTSTGQSCIAGSRLFLHDDIYDAFLEELVAQTNELTVGDPFDDDVDLAPIATHQQFEKVQEYVEIGREEGAEVVTGGRPIDDEELQLLFEPTIFVDVDDDMRIAREEVFGPVLCVFSFQTEEEVIERANDTRFGLASGVWTADVSRAVRVSEALEAGVVWVNSYRHSSFTTPFGGHKDSGVGLEKGVEAIEEYLQTKSVWIRTDGSISGPST